MFFNKKKVNDELNPIAIHFKELWNECRDSQKSIYKAMLTVIARQNIINLYPEGADKDIAIKRFEDAKIKFRNTISAYDDAKRKLQQYYAVKKYDIDFIYPTWSIYSWKESADVVENFYRNINNLWIKES